MEAAAAVEKKKTTTDDALPALYASRAAMGPYQRPCIGSYAYGKLECRRQVPGLGAVQRREQLCRIWAPMSSVQLISYLTEHAGAHTAQSVSVSHNGPTLLYTAPQRALKRGSITQDPIEVPHPKRAKTQQSEQAAEHDEDEAAAAERAHAQAASNSWPPSSWDVSESDTSLPLSQSSQETPPRPEILLFKVAALRRRLRRRLDLFIKNSGSPRRVKASGAASVAYIDSVAQELVSDAGRLSPHPVDALYAYLIHHRILLSMPSASMQRAREDAAASRRPWTAHEHVALYAYVFEEMPQTLQQWERIGARLNRTGAACKSRFHSIRNAVEQEIVQFYAAQKAAATQRGE